MGFDAVTYAMAKSYTNSVIDSGGGVLCLILP